MSSSITWASRIAGNVPAAASGRLLLCLLCCLQGTEAFAQAFGCPGTEASGTIFPAQTITVAIRRSGMLSSVRVLGQGNARLDFANENSGSCAVGVSYPVGQTCTVSVSFAPVYPGVRSGAVVLADQNGAVIGIEFVSVTGMEDLAQVMAPVGNRLAPGQEQADDSGIWKLISKDGLSSATKYFNLSASVQVSRRAPSEAPSSGNSIHRHPVFDAALIAENPPWQDNSSNYNRESRVP